MAKLALKNRELRRTQLVKKFASRRAELMDVLRSPKSTAEARITARNELQALPRDASPVRQRNRCALTGRPRGVYRKFGLARGKLRELAMRGDIPGVIKASW